MEYKTSNIFHKNYIYIYSLNVFLVKEFVRSQCMFIKKLILIKIDLIDCYFFLQEFQCTQ